MADFKWHTEENDWDHETVPVEKSERPPKRIWLRIGIGLIIVAIIGTVIYSQVQKQIEAAVQRAEDDVRQTHDLVLQAADQSDRDLLNNLVSSRNSEWLNQQLAVTEAGLLFNPRSFGLVSTGESVIEYDFELSADLNAAEVKTIRSFTGYSAGGKVQTVRLEQAVLYRRGDNRWLFSPPEDGQEFWGETATLSGQYLSIDYPERDAAQVEPLLAYLDSKIDEMCTKLSDFSCPTGLEIELTLETVPASQLRLHEEETDLEYNGELSLPTLSLVGRPVDQAAADALYRGYGVHVVRVAMIKALEVLCCQHALMIHALTDYQLAELDLRSYPMLPGDYETIFSHFLNIGTLNDTWRSRETDLLDAEDWRWAYAITEFLITTSMSDHSASALLQSLDESGSYLNWLSEVLVVDVRDATLQQAWLNFVYGRSLSGQIASAASTPDQKIVLRCNNISTPRSILYFYDWVSQDWQLLDQFEKQTLFMKSMPDDSAIVVQFGDQNSASSTLLWEDGAEQLLSDGSNNELAGYYFIGRIAPNGRELAMWSSDPEAGPGLLNIDDCTESGCQLTPVDGFPTWSPDSSQKIIELRHQDNGTLTIRGLVRIDEEGDFHQLSTEAGSPFWFSSHEYGFLAFEPEPGLYGANVSDDKPQLLLAREEMLQALPEDIRPPDLIIRSADPSPANKDMVAITAYGYQYGVTDVFVFLWNRQNAKITYLTEIDEVVIGLSEWLPGGEWLLLPTYRDPTPIDSFRSPWTFHLFNSDPTIPPMAVDSDQISGLNGIDFSSDGEWLLAAYPTYLELIHLNTDMGQNQPYRQILTHDFNNCQQPLFIW